MTHESLRGPPKARAPVVRSSACRRWEIRSNRPWTSRRRRSRRVGPRDRSMTGVAVIPISGVTCESSPAFIARRLTRAERRDVARGRAPVTASRRIHAAVLRHGVQNIVRALPGIANGGEKERLRVDLPVERVDTRACRKRSNIDVCERQDRFARDSGRFARCRYGRSRRQRQPSRRGLRRRPRGRPSARSHRRKVRREQVSA